MSKYEPCSIEMPCDGCGEKFTQYFWLEDGPFHNCCSEECYEEYYSKENTRDRRINYILNEVQDKV